jgi:regulator of cell morphogenesis and NO signaling
MLGTVRPEQRIPREMSIAPNTRLADIVTAEPSLARELERLGLDYCCGGTQTLEQACAANDLDTRAVVGDLVAASRPQSTVEAWTTMDAARLVDHIESTHHRYLDDELPRLTELAHKVVGVHASRHRELREVATVLGELRADLEPHLLKEERVLFPMIRELATATTLPAFHCGSIRNPITVMMAEHDTAGDLLDRLRDATHDYEPPSDACASYTALYRGLSRLEADTHLHVHKENNVLFPMVEAIESRLKEGGPLGGEAPCYAHLLDDDGGATRY